MADNAPVLINRKLVEWDAQGNPLVTTVPFLTKPQINDIISAAVSAPYDDPLMLEPEYAGWSNMAVMMHKLADRAAKMGNADDVKDLLNRILGSPLQKSETKTLHLTYEDRLREIQRQEQATVAAAKPVGPVIEAVPPYQGEDDPLA